MHVDTIEINGFHLQNFAELEYFWPDWQTGEVNASC